LQLAERKTAKDSFTLISGSEVINRAYLKKNAIFLKWAFLPENLDLSSLNICENGGKISFESAQPF
jgi:hypothetical protein